MKRLTYLCLYFSILLSTYSLLAPFVVAADSDSKNYKSGQINWAAAQAVTATLTITETQVISESISILPTVTSTISRVAETAPNLSDALNQPISGADIVRFNQLGFNTKTLQGPIESSTFWFSVPASWKFTGQAAINLEFNTFFGSESVDASGTSMRQFGGTILVELNDVTVGTLLLDQAGLQIATLLVPPEALMLSDGDSRHQLRLTLETFDECGTEFGTSIIISANSSLLLPHTIEPVPIDLSHFPYPVYQRSFEPDVATLIVPDAPSEAVLQAAMNIAAGIGRITRGGLDLSLIPISQLNLALRDTTHLIFVGQVESFPILQNVDLPLDLADNSLVSSAEFQAQGMIQMANSPWNPERVILLAGGHSDQGILKSSQALSTGRLQVANERNYALVTAVNADSILEDQPSSIVEQTLFDMGYRNRTFDRVGTQSAVYQFDLSTEQLNSSEAFIDLSYSHSELLDYQLSSVLITLNDEPISSVQFDAESGNVNQKRIHLPSSATKVGDNRLEVQVNLIPLSPCAETQSTAIFFSVWADSLLHLPISDSTPFLGTEPRAGLRDYPLPYILNPQLATTGFILPRDEPFSWNIATQLAFDLGRKMKGELANLTVSYADLVPDEIDFTGDLIIIGIPNELPIIRELNSELPVPFNLETNQAVDQYAQVIYQLPVGTSLGYLELLPSPRNSEHNISLILGTDYQGLVWAFQALVTSQLRNQLTGDFAAIIGEQIFPTDTQFVTKRNLDSAVDGAAIPSLPVIEADPANTPNIDRMPWLFPAILVTSTLMLLVVIMAISLTLFGRWKRRRTDAEQPS